MEIGNIKENAIAMQKKIILDLRENFGSESSRENAVEKLNQIVDDYEKDNNNIDAENIHLYYEFMSDEDLNELSDLFLSSLLLERHCLVVKDEEIFPTLKNSWWENVTIKSMPYIIVGSGTTGYKDIGRSFFGIKDTLKPIDEYIEDIKNSDGYNNYIYNYENSLINDTSLEEAKNLVEEHNLVSTTPSIKI